MKSMIMVVACLSCLFGCVADGGPSRPNPACAFVAGTYPISYHKVSGTCGDLPPGIITINDAGVPDVPVGCEYDGHYNGCVVDYGQNCPNPGGNVAEEGSLTWSSDGAHATGFVELVLQRGTGGCTASYDLIVGTK